MGMDQEGQTLGYEDNCILQEENASGSLLTLF